MNNGWTYTIIFIAGIVIGILLAMRYRNTSLVDTDGVSIRVDTAYVERIIPGSPVAVTKKADSIVYRDKWHEVNTVQYIHDTTKVYVAPDGYVCSQPFTAYADSNLVNGDTIGGEYHYPEGFFSLYYRPAPDTLQERIITVVNRVREPRNFWSDVGLVAGGAALGYVSRWLTESTPVTIVSTPMPPRGMPIITMEVRLP